MSSIFDFSILVAFHILAMAAMTGLIWFVQVVHYPLFSKVGSDGWRSYHNSHTSLTTYVVAPLMLIELATAILLVLGNMENPWLIANLTGVGSLWLSTAFIQVPLHHQLGEISPNEAQFLEKATKLVSTNWIRTTVWTARSVGWGLYLIDALH